ncbi:hypothetical protein BH23PLA1_BH23PLA1_00980 [soil metagenome]
MILNLRILFQRRIVALCLDDCEATLLLLATTPLGVMGLDRRTEPLGEGARVDVVLSRMLSELRNDPAWKDAPIALALQASACIFVSQPTKPTSLLRSPSSSTTVGGRYVSGSAREAVARTLLRDVFQASNLDLSDLEVDQLHKAHGKQGTDSLAAVRRAYLTPVLDVLDQVGFRPFLVEPAPCALLRGAIARHRSPRSARGVIRVVLGQDRGIALLTRSDALLAWRVFELPEAMPEDAILSAVRQLLHSSPRYGAILTPDHMIVHGRIDLAMILKGPDWLRLPLKVAWLDGPGLDPEAVARGLAMGFDDGIETFNLARSLRKRRSALSLFPFGQVLLQAGLLAGATLFLQIHLAGLENKCSTILHDRSRHEWTEGQSLQDLKAEDKKLTDQSKAVLNYLDSRILWSDCLRDIASRLPENVQLTALRGFAEYSEPKGKRPAPTKRQLILDMQAPIPDGVVPREIDGLIESLRAGPALGKALPSIEMGPVRWEASVRNQAIPTASFTVACRPGTAPKSNPARAEPALIKGGG